MPLGLLNQGAAIRLSSEVEGGSNAKQYLKSSVVGRG